MEDLHLYKKLKVVFQYFIQINMHPGSKAEEATLHYIAKSINELIKKVLQLETRGLGAKSNVKRGYSLDEFKKVVELLRR
jgi:endonuclease IV